MWWGFIMASDSAGLVHMRMKLTRFSKSAKACR